MKKIVIDTNVIVSALIQNNFPFLVLNYILSRKDYSICLSNELFAEYFNVLNREKFGKYKDFKFKAEQVLSELETIGIVYYPKTKLNIISDIDDNKLLELCMEAEAEFLITGNTNDFSMKKFQKTLILTPKEFWDIYCF
jgi:uncharacterized protein